MRGPVFNPCVGWLGALGFLSVCWRGLEIHLHGKTFLRDFYEASCEAGVRPFLMWGTLLGCVRERRLLKHDNDIDLGILWTDYAKKERLVASMQRRGYYVPIDSPYKLRFKRPFCRLWIDVDVFYPWDGKMISCWCEDGKLLATSFYQKAFDHFAEISFLGDLQVLIPDPPSSVLTTIYGDWHRPNSHYDSERDLLNRLHVPPGQPTPRLPITTPGCGGISRDSLARI
jgi:hypothetical protein